MKNLLLLLFCLGSIFSFSQYEDQEFKSFKVKEAYEYDDTKRVFKLSFVFPSIGGEFRLAEKFSLDASLRLGINAGIARNTSGVPQFYFFPQPVIHLEPKWNYNISRRNKKGKITQNFSSNFLSIHTSFNFKVSNPTFNYLTIGPTWGVQRNFGDYGYFKFKSGIGYRHIFNRFAGNFPLVPIINFQLGLMF